eukprot:GILK01010784.1.p1 GENE.GILK01010784.1~~GILK01010784.1.p1  ORF type:complete len:230 (+),score=38.23 GILK01010784.1:10-699(+)
MWRVLWCLCLCVCRLLQCEAAVQDFYKVLGLECQRRKFITHEDIRKSYRRLAVAVHPDKHPNDTAQAERNFIELSDAYTLLSDAAQRSQYDALLTKEEVMQKIKGRKTWSGGFSHSFTFDIVFEPPRRPSRQAPAAKKVRRTEESRLHTAMEVFDGLFGDEKDPFRVFLQGMEGVGTRAAGEEEVAAQEWKFFEFGSTPEHMADSSGSLANRRAALGLKVPTFDTDWEG